MIDKHETNFMTQSEVNKLEDIELGIKKYSDEMLIFINTCIADELNLRLRIKRSKFLREKAEMKKK
jgi:hypothetical protein